MSDSPDTIEAAADDGPALELDEPPQPAPPEPDHDYRVLARKYRPQSFDQLIGQDAVVQTLANAIKRDRLAHAFLLTGVRGVGKTTTARLIAKALNCVGADGEGGPTIEPCGECEPCLAIAEGRHIDVVEMDAASHTGVDDIREIIDAVRYASVSARYKVYIIDEVHMLSKNAFNALLKTLEEPPPHVKFIFATTEVNKVPVTVLSRCQRFDLRRIASERLVEHFRWVAEQEQVEAEEEALRLIARAAEGSVRDGLSMLDQAIAHGTDGVTAEQVHDMLGLSDRGAIRDLYAALLDANAEQVLEQVDAQYDLGVDPVALFRGLLQITHAVVRAKVGGEGDAALSAEERAAFAEWASKLGFAPLHRMWQLLLKGLHEVETAPTPLEAAEMALLRIVHAASLPDPGELARKLEEGAVATSSPAETVAAPAGKAPASFAGLIAALEDSGEHLLAVRLHDQVGLIRYAPPELVIKPLQPIEQEELREIAVALKSLSGEHWTVSLDDGEAEPSLREQEQRAEAAARQAVLDSPIVKEAIEAFPDAELLDYKRATGE